MEGTVATALDILPLDKDHNRKTFSCGVDSLDNYFQHQAGQDLRKRIAAIYVLYDKDMEKVAGFYTLSAASIEVVTLPKVLQKKLPSYSHMPATLLGRLAIDQSYRKRGYGEILLIDALKRSCKASEKVASFAVVVDAIDQTAEKFYKQYGFIDLSCSVNRKRLFLSMKMIEQF